MENIKEWHLNEIAGMYKKAIGICVERSKKYASEDDPFKNFRSAAAFAGTDVSRGILTRIGDKLSRLQNAIERAEDGDEYSDESFDDTIIDLCNYFVILRNWRIVERDELAESQRQLRLFEELEVPAEPEPKSFLKTTLAALGRKSGVTVE